MGFTDDYKIKGIKKKISIELKVPEATVLLAYNTFWKYIKENIEVLPLKESISEDEFNNLKVSFNIPSLGKLSTNYKRVESMNRNINKIKTKKYDKVKESNPDV